jgi:serine/threonine protein kinase
MYLFSFLQKIKQWTFELLSALEYLSFQADFFHGNISAESIVFTAQEHIKIDPTLMRIDEKPDVRTEAYWPPEYFKQDYSDKKMLSLHRDQKYRQDVFSIAVVIYQLVMLHKPELNSVPIGKALANNPEQSLDPLFASQVWTDLWFIKETLRVMFEPKYMQRETAKKALRHYQLFELLSIPRKYYSLLVTMGVIVIGSLKSWKIKSCLLAYHEIIASSL